MVGVSEFWVKISLQEEQGFDSTYVVQVPVKSEAYNGLVAAIDEAKQMLIESIANDYARGKRV